MKNNIILFIKGIIVGLGKIMPGVSGSVLAITLGIYDKCLIAISNIKKNIFFLTPIAFGIIFSIIIFSKLVTLLLNKNYFLTMSFFIGLILGSIPNLYINSKIKINKMSNIFIIIITILTIAFFNSKINLNISLKDSFITNLIIGLIEAISSIIPGISGTAILIILNSYDRVIFYFSNILNIYYLKKTISFFIPFGIGTVSGMVILSKIIIFFFQKYKEKTYCVIFGLVLSSIYLLINNLQIKNYLLFLLSLTIGITINIIINKIITK